jgi:glycosyltransferase involved in cell wall biosynthesis
LIHAHGYGAANFARLAGLVTRVPVIVHAHDEDPHYPWYQAVADLLLGPFTDLAIAVSASVKESCVRRRRIPDARVSVMHIGIPLDHFQAAGSEDIRTARRDLGIDVNAPVIGTLAVLREVKGIEYLLKSVPRVLALFPRAVFVIVGDGPLRAKLESLARELGIWRSVVFAGYREDVARMLSVFDITVLPSLSEGFSLVLVEAMALGRPVIASAVGGIREILKNGQTGVLVPPGESEAIADAIVNLLRHEERRRGLGERALLESRKYGLDSHVRELERVYEKLLGTGSTMSTTL